MKKEIPFEYFCNSCGQLRLSFKDTLTTCGNCRSSDITEANPGSLNKQSLRTAFILRAATNTAKKLKEKGEENGQKTA